METLRSALDYSANEIFMKYGHSPKAKPRIYFPYIQVGQTHTDFHKRVEECMPGVLATRPGILAILEAYQPLSSGDNWLPLFMELCNDNKHQSLTPQNYVEG